MIDDIDIWWFFGRSGFFSLCLFYDLQSFNRPETLTTQQPSFLSPANLFMKLARWTHVTSTWTLANCLVNVAISTKKCPSHVAPDRFVADRSVPNSAVEHLGLWQHRGSLSLSRRYARRRYACNYIGRERDRETTGWGSMGEVKDCAVLQGFLVLVL